MESETELKLPANTNFSLHPEAFPIGIYQFNNLIENRVPFALLHFQISFESYFKALPMHHIRRVAVEIPEVANILDWFSELKWEKEQAIVLVCNSGQESLKWAQKFTSLGYINVYYLEDGWLKQTMQGTEPKG